MSLPNLTRERIIADLKLSEGRMRHTLGVVKCAKELSTRHFPSLDIDKVESAALLHDCTKEHTLSEHKALCEKYGIEVPEEERGEPKLYHAKTAAAIAKNVFFQDDEVFTAIFFHTTGRADMSPLETIIYFADYIEPYRTDQACVALREYYHDCLRCLDPQQALQRALLRSFDTTIEHIITKNAWLCPLTVEARNHIIKLLNKEGK